MAIRNFYIDADIDGRKTPLSGGPAGKDGEMQIILYQRDDGDIARAFTIPCIADGDELETWVRNRNGQVVYVERTSR